ncbi:hypothetical protein FF2_008136 [Malus domestica]
MEIKASFETSVWNLESGYHVIYVPGAVRIPSRDYGGFILSTAYNAQDPRKFSPSLNFTVPFLFAHAKATVPSILVNLRIFSSELQACIGEGMR